jgi:hypothetical protein
MRLPDRVDWAEMVERVEYPGLDLSHLYVS